MPENSLSKRVSAEKPYPLRNSLARGVEESEPEMADDPRDEKA
jgi:hypothetical protein